MIKRNERIKNEKLKNEILGISKEKIKIKINNLGLKLLKNLCLILGTYVLNKYFDDEFIDFIEFLISLFE